MPRKIAGQGWQNRNSRTGKLICGADFNETQFGWDTCTRDSGHRGDHYDGISKHYGSNT
jgi:hypothetical protein